MFFARQCVFLGVTDYAVSVFRRRVYGVESKVGTFGCVDYIVPSACRDDDTISVLDAVFHTVDDYFSFSGFKSKELIMILMGLFTISSPGVRLINTNWLCLPVYNTRRKSTFFLVSFSRTSTYPFRTIKKNERVKVLEPIAKSPNLKVDRNQKLMYFERVSFSI